MPRTKLSPTRLEEDESNNQRTQQQMASTNILDKCYGDMEKFLINYKKRDEEKKKLNAFKTESRHESNHSLQMQNPKPAPGRQLSKAERYRWIIQEPSSTNQQNSSIRGGSPKNQRSPSSPNGTSRGLVQNTAGVGPAGDVSYNSRLIKSIMKGASDFKCKHCGESFDKLDSLTKHMMIQGHFTETDDDAQAADSLNLSRKSSASMDLRANFNGEAKNPAKKDEESSAAKVLSCLRCGASFDSLPDLSCHMARTNHHESIPSLKTFNSSTSSPFSQLPKPGQKGFGFPTQNSLQTASLPSVPLFPPSSLGASFLQPSALAGRIPMLPGSLPLYNAFFPLMRPQVSHTALQSLLQQQTLALLQTQLHQNLAAQTAQKSDNEEIDDSRSHASSSRSPSRTNKMPAASCSRLSSSSGRQGGGNGEEPLDLSKKRPLRHRIIPLDREEPVITESVKNRSSLSRSSSFRTFLDRYGQIHCIANLAPNYPIGSCSRSNSPILEKESAMSHDSDIDIVAPTSPGNENIHEDHELEPPSKMPHLDNPTSPDNSSSRKSSASPPRGNPIMAIENLINSQNLEKKKQSGMAKK
ncbi:Oidioi.mRNA.OKI2018_I69.chr1.g419.t1.cds [Oikopleura dioica]|uniref:Oidioi.mRNA.OKI2018_I69.chr1.g419.t1.cds n=1 Tax=Oikopleura dioica TaxID=34765 RepID=A0ABN7SNM7_OIKDI|nr:Oidioi.mRNA.OKI2018_I69.chr1.g419.t1.cds [Oikopleura dioica]